MEVVIYEDDARVGVVDLDARTFEYDGESDRLRDLLQRMEADELTQLQPTLEGSKLDPDTPRGENGRDHRPGMVERVLEGKTLGRQIRQTAKTVSTSDTPMRVEAIGGSLEADTITLPGSDYTASDSDNDWESETTSERGGTHFGPLEDNE